MMLYKIAMISFVLHLSENILIPHMTIIGRELRLSDGEKDLKLGGMLYLAYYASVAAVSVAQSHVAARLKLSLANVLTCCTTGLALCCLGLSAYGSYNQLIFLRCAIGAIFAAAEPCMFAAIFERAQFHAKPNHGAVLSVGAGAGVLCGHALSGLCLQRGVSYRSLYLCMSFMYATLALHVGLAAWLRGAVSPPAPGAVHSQADARRSTGHKRTVWSESRALASDVQQLMRTSSNALIFSQGVFGCIPLSVVTAYMSDFLVEDGGIHLADANLCVVLFGLGSALGLWCGSSCGSALRRRDMHAALFSLSAVVCWCAIVPCVALFDAEYVRRASLPAIGGWMTAVGILSNFSGSNLRAAVTDVNSPSSRALGLSVFHACNGAGRACGPMLVPLLMRQASVRRDRALSMTTSAWILSGLLLLRVGRHVARDTRRANQQPVLSTTRFGDVGLLQNSYSAPFR